MLRLLIFLQFFLSSVEAGRAEDALVNNHNFTETAARRYLENFNKLTSLQMELLGTKPIQNDFAEAFDAVPNRPDEQPYLFEGDILLNEEQMQRHIEDAKQQLEHMRGQNTIDRSRRSMTTDRNLWTIFPIPYAISHSVDSAAIERAIDRWQQETCVTFQKVHQISNHGIKFKLTTNECSSDIGMQWGRQVINLTPGCFNLGTVMHEIGHALGVYHEQSRWDRDTYVTIYKENINRTMLGNFVKMGRNMMNDHGVPYDLGSVMHYHSTAFSINDRNTTVTKDPNYRRTIGQRIVASFADIKRINRAYCSAICFEELPCKNNGYTDPKDCSKCKCPDGLAGKFCDQPAESDSECGLTTLTATSEIQSIDARGKHICNYMILAPPGKVVYYKIESFENFQERQNEVCDHSYLELKYDEDMGTTGPRFCRDYRLGGHSKTNLLLVLYHGGHRSSFKLNFRFHPPGEPETSTSTSPPPSTTTESTSTRPYEETTVTSTTTTASCQKFPYPIEGPYPVVIPAAGVTPTYLWKWLPNLFSSTIAPVTTTEVTTTTTQSPSSQVECGAWTECPSSPCGGCELQYRYCTGGMQKRACNTEPCSVGAPCCYPYNQVVGGQCMTWETYEKIFVPKTTDRGSHITSTQVPINRKRTKKPNKPSKKSKPQKGKKRPLHKFNRLPVETEDIHVDPEGSSIEGSGEELTE